jgi:hypothetical protein
VTGISGAGTPNPSLLADFRPPWRVVRGMRRDQYWSRIQRLSLRPGLRRVACPARSLDGRRDLVLRCAGDRDAISSPPFSSESHHAGVDGLFISNAVARAGCQRVSLRAPESGQWRGADRCRQVVASRLTAPAPVVLVVTGGEPLRWRWGAVGSGGWLTSLVRPAGMSGGRGVG